MIIVSVQFSDFNKIHMEQRGMPTSVHGLLNQGEYHFCFLLLKGLSLLIKYKDLFMSHITCIQPMMNL